MEAIITALSSDHYEEYQKIMSMIDFLEFVGILESRGYLKIDDIAPLLGLRYVDMNALLGSYIRKLTAYYKQTFEAMLPNMTPVFLYYSDLSAKFSDRFGPSSPGGQR